MRRIPREGRAQASGYRRTLLGKRAELLPSLGMKFDHLGRMEKVAEEDQAAISHDEYIFLSVSNLDYQQLTLVEEALERIGTGEFGVCQGCGEGIPARRLKAIPWARYCIDCQNQLGAAQGGSVQGTGRLSSD